MFSRVFVGCKQTCGEGEREGRVLFFLDRVSKRKEACGYACVCVRECIHDVKCGVYVTRRWMDGYLGQENL